MRIGLISDLHVDINEAFPILELTAETAGMQSDTGSDNQSSGKTAVTVSVSSILCTWKS